MSRHTAFADCPERLAPRTSILLDRSEAAHLRTLRLRPGDEIRITNGRGLVGRAEIESIGTDGAACVWLGETPGQTPPRTRLAFGIGQKQRTLWLVEKAVELGVASLVPVEFRRSRSVNDAARGERFWKRAERRARAALKQSGGAWLPRLARPRPLEEYLGDPGERETDGGLRIWAERNAARPLWALLQERPPSEFVEILVGPEGGCEPGERDRIQSAGFFPASLGPGTLRFETAAVAALAVVAQAEALGNPGLSRSGVHAPQRPQLDTDVC